MSASDRLASLMPIVIKDDQLHARWLNTFSYLEYVGFRKIIKSQRARRAEPRLSQPRAGGRRPRLSAQEHGGEGRRQGISISTRRRPCSARRQRAPISKISIMVATRNSPACRMSERAKIVYLYVTWLIERRALDVYGRYKEALGASPLSEQLDELLDEEVGHLRQVEAGLARRRSGTCDARPRF